VFHSVPAIDELIVAPALGDNQGGTLNLGSHVMGEHEATCELRDCRAESRLGSIRTTPLITRMDSNSVHWSWGAPAPEVESDGAKAPHSPFSISG
jgi:hypothetical protein